jgi:hypothetical protein
MEKYNFMKQVIIFETEKHNFLQKFFLFPLKNMKMRQVPASNTVLPLRKILILLVREVTVNVVFFWESEVSQADLREYIFGIRDLDRFACSHWRFILEAKTIYSGGKKDNILVIGEFFLLARMVYSGGSEGLFWWPIRSTEPAWRRRFWVFW